MNVTDLRKGERRTETPKVKGKDEDFASNAEVDQPLVDLRSGKDRRHSERQMSESSEELGADESFVRVPINSEIQNLLLDMYSDDNEEQ